MVSFQALLHAMGIIGVGLLQLRCHCLNQQYYSNKDNAQQ